jgi:hypothetical protein
VAGRDFLSRPSNNIQGDGAIRGVMETRTNTKSFPADPTQVRGGSPMLVAALDFIDLAAIAVLLCFVAGVAASLYVGPRIDTGYTASNTSWT